MRVHVFASLCLLFLTTPAIAQEDSCEGVREFATSRAKIYLCLDSVESINKELSQGLSNITDDLSEKESLIKGLQKSNSELLSKYQKESEILAQCPRSCAKRQDFSCWR